jgi:glucose/arabinose dehydrogenase
MYAFARSKRSQLLSAATLPAFALSVLLLKGCSSDPATATATDAGAGGVDATTNTDGGGPKADSGVPDDPKPTVDVTLNLVRAFDDINFKAPVEIIQGPDGYIYVAEQAGIIKRFSASNTTPEQVFKIETAKIVSGGEAGLLGLALHPDFKSNGYVYMYYTVPLPAGTPVVDRVRVFQSKVSRFKSDDGGKTIDAGSELEIMLFDQPYANHNGGKIAFGPDGFLYLSFGDGGSSGDPQKYGQNTQTFLGKLLRIDVADEPYSIPADNPFAKGGGKPEIYAYGLRNTWKFSFDRKTGDLWGADVGQDAYEEINKITLGGNYGWNSREGKHCYSPKTNCKTEGLIDPVAEYGHSVGLSITGGYVYRGSKIPELVGKYLYGDQVKGNFWALHPETATITELNVEGPKPKVASFFEADDGEVYVLDYLGGVYEYQKQ